MVNVRVRADLFIATGKKNNGEGINVLISCFVENKLLAKGSILY